jgi:hypothetical protein
MVIVFMAMADLERDLIRRPNFVRPFLLSCASRNPKYAGTAISSLQRLVVLHGLSPETVKDVLDVLRDCTSLGQAAIIYLIHDETNMI